MTIKRLLTNALLGCSLVTAVIADDNDEWRYGGGMMHGYGSMGPGMMQGHGGNMMQGYSRGMGQGMMFGYGSGMGSGMPLDHNGDGQVSADEAAAYAEIRFGMFDQNGDGQIEEGEFMQMGHPRWYEKRKVFFSKMDGNSDGKVTLEEFLTLHQTKYQNADKNKDGKVDPWEFRGQGRW